MGTVWTVSTIELTAEAMNVEVGVHQFRGDFEAADRYSAVVGSANITEAALTSNEELSYVVGGIKGDAQHQTLAAYLARLDRRCRRYQAPRIDKNGNPIPLVYR